MHSSHGRPAATQPGTASRRVAETGTALVTTDAGSEIAADNSPYCGITFRSWLLCYNHGNEPGEATARCHPPAHRGSAAPDPASSRAGSDKGRIHPRPAAPDRSAALLRSALLLDLRAEYHQGLQRRHRNAQADGRELG